MLPYKTTFPAVTVLFEPPIATGFVFAPSVIAVVVVPRNNIAEARPKSLAAIVTAAEPSNVLLPTVYLLLTFDTLAALPVQEADEPVTLIPQLPEAPPPVLVGA